MQEPQVMAPVIKTTDFICGQSRIDNRFAWDGVHTQNKTWREPLNSVCYHSQYIGRNQAQKSAS